MENAELIFVAAPMVGHLVPEVELARRLTSQHPHISISILIPKLPIPDRQTSAFLQSLKSTVNDQISLLELPSIDSVTTRDCSKRISFLLDHLSRLYIPKVKQFVEQSRRRTVGIAVDLFCAPIIDAAEELGLPSYVLFPSGANWLSLMLKLETLQVDVASEFGELPPESTPLEVPGYRNPVPVKFWPAMVLNKQASALIMRNFNRYRSTNGILVNSFTDLESDLLRSLSEDARNPPIYAVGPVLDVDREIKADSIRSWLDCQPAESVVFLCFGSLGSFEKEQVRQIAAGIEQSGQRFLWSVREEAFLWLPEGFVERTAEMGRVIGWAAQTEVLSHAAVAAFVSHCGWNSVLESLWFGVPVVTWPMYAEQHLNALLLVRELGIALELTLDFQYDFGERRSNMVVMAAEVETGISRMMEGEDGVEVRIKVKNMSRLARKAVEIGGSSTKSMSKFVHDLINNSSSISI